MSYAISDKVGNINLPILSYSLPFIQYVKRVFTMGKRADIKWWISIKEISYPARYVTCPEASFSPGQVAILQPHWGFTYLFHENQWTEGANVTARHRLCAHNCFSQWMMYAQWLTGSGVQTGPFLGFTIKVRIRWVLTGHHSTMVIYFIRLWKTTNNMPSRSLRLNLWFPIYHFATLCWNTLSNLACGLMSRRFRQFWQLSIVVQWVSR